MAPQIQAPLVAPGTLVLLTAANGLIASHVLDTLLEYGYRVRATVRSKERSSWMDSLFKSRHPNSSFEIVEVSDISAPGCYDAILAGVSAVIHTAANTSLSTDDSAIQDAIDANINILEAAKRANQNGEKVQKVVFTTSSWAVMYPRPNTEKKLDVDTYDEFAASMLANPELPAEFKGMMVYVESKKRAEQESWTWYKAQQDSCGFQLNSVIPATCIGPVLAPEQQPYSSTAGFVRSTYEGKNEFLDFLEPQYYVDVRDAARLHVAGAVLDGVSNERIYAYAETYTWPQVAEVLEKEMGGKVPVQPKDKGKDLTTVVTQDKSEGYLKRLGLSGWTGFDESVKLCIRSFYPKA